MTVFIHSDPVTANILRIEQRTIPSKRMAVVMKLLLAESNLPLMAGLTRELSDGGYLVDVARSHRDVTSLLEQADYDVLMIDADLEHGTGADTIRALRREGCNAPILLFAPPEAHEAIVQGLDAGADDYLTKPFRVDELLSRIRALQRRHSSDRLDSLQLGPLKVDRLRHRVTANGLELTLTALEFRMLEYFMLHPGHVIRRSRLIDQVWHHQFDPESNVVDVHVSKLRRKLRSIVANPHIETVRGVGYSLRLDPDLREPRSSGGTAMPDQPNRSSAPTTAP